MKKEEEKKKLYKNMVERSPYLAKRLKISIFFNKWVKCKNMVERSPFLAKISVFFNYLVKCINFINFINFFLGQPPRWSIVIHKYVLNDEYPFYYINKEFWDLFISENDFFVNFNILVWDLLISFPTLTYFLISIPTLTCFLTFFFKLIKEKKKKK